MRRNARCPRPRTPRPPQPEVWTPRRGNSIVLVMAILVLLVIIATAFITRTHAGRVTANVMVRTTLRDDNARVIAEMLASEIGAALFPFPVDPLFPGVDQPVNSNIPRLSQRRLDLDGDGVFEYLPLRYATDPTVPYNFAPYHVVPFTNWPDTAPGGPADPLWPDGPGNDGGGTGSPNLDAEGNPIGNPGFSDNRWFADTEPLRWDSDGDGVLNAFSHWRHMTNLARPNNGWRICRSISDITNANGFGGIVEDLSIPVEQWLVVQPEASILDNEALFNTLTGDTIYKDYFNSRWVEWFLNYGDVYYDPQTVPPNFYNLGDLNANGTAFDHPDGDLPQDEFNAGSARHAVSSILADSDGDGFTDSFWFLAPTMTERGIRQIVAVRIIDNSAMLNANVATRFLRNDTDILPPGPAYKTRGHTPADLALVGQINTDPFTLPSDTWNVGFFDNHANWEGNPPPPDGDGSIFFPGFLGSANAQDSPYGTSVVRYRDVRWDDDLERDFLSEIGVDGNPIFFGNAELERADGRLTYWRLAGLRPFSATGGLTPFTLADELELRMYHGNNYPWVMSRFERSVNTIKTQNAFLHSTNDQFINQIRVESSEYLDQLSNRELMFDSRRKLTLFNGARNDEMPPWLWWRWDIPQDVEDEAIANPEDLDGNGVSDVIDRFLAQARTKVDLRQPELGLGLPPGLHNFRERLAPTLLLALIDGDGNSGTSYFGPYTSDPATLENARLAAAGLAANIREWRDDDSELKLADAEPLPKLTAFGPVGDDLRMLGMERQPFLVEAFIGHVYKGELVEPPGGYTNSGNYVVNDETLHTTAVVVQIANPFGTVLQFDSLNDFRLRIFDDGNGSREIDLKTLPVSSVASGSAMTLYAMEPSLGGEDFEGPWFNELQLGDPFANAQNVTMLSTISTNRDVYDTGDEERAIEILRMIPPVGGGPNVPVVVDRIDIKAPTENFDFGESVTELAEQPPPPFVLPPPPFQDPLETYPGLDIGTDTHWIEWVNVTRAWHDDFAVANGLIDAEERNPRYVFATHSVANVDADSYLLDTGTGVISGFDPGADEINFHQFDKVFVGGPFSMKYSLQMLQKDADFEQVGELLNVWMFGHELEFAGDIYQETDQTFSEFMVDDDLTNDDDPLVNRLRMEPTSVGATLGQVVGIPLTADTDPMYLLDFQHAVPTIPAGARVLDAFVCDDRGVNGIAGVDEFLNANGYSGKITPGLINVNTAPVEVMRALPHMTRMVHELASPATNFYIRLPEAIIRYRERFGDPTSMNAPPGYGDRGDANFLDNPDLDDLRGDRGIASISELMLLTREATFTTPLGPWEPNENWQVDFAGLRPPAFLPPGGVESTRISTDVNDVFDPNLPGDVPDEVAQDAEELNLLFAGMSNMLTTRSDVFTVYFRVRSFIQNPTTRVWDATNPEFIVDDSRYVMLVDRSEVNHPNDKPKILYLEKLLK